MHAYQEIIQKLGLLPHPEGGYYRKQWLSSTEVIMADEDLHAVKGNRRIGSSILYLLASHEISSWHKLDSDEMWHFYKGSSLILHLIDSQTGLQEKLLGVDLDAGESPQILIPKGTWFCTEVSAEDSYSLCGCCLWPAFSYADFKLASPDEMQKLYPNHIDLIQRLKNKQNKL